MVFNASGMGCNHTVKWRLDEKDWHWGRLSGQGKFWGSTGRHGMVQAQLCRTGARQLCWSGVQVISLNFWKALSAWAIAGLTASSPELVLKEELWHPHFWCRHLPVLLGTAWPQRLNVWPLPPCWKALTFCDSVGSALVSPLHGVTSTSSTLETDTQGQIAEHYVQFLFVFRTTH